jgi:hypothetical protein
VSADGATFAPGIAPVASTAGAPARSCSETVSFFSGTAIADHERRYGKHLAAMKEEPLVGARYRVVARWSPRPDGPDPHFRAAAAWMLAKSGFFAM